VCVKQEINGVRVERGEGEVYYKRKARRRVICTISYLGVKCMLESILIRCLYHFPAHKYVSVL
jgi:hypothetical protein